MKCLADKKLKNKLTPRLHERNYQLHVQIESSEENLEEIQAHNEKLKDDIKRFVIPNLGECMCVCVTHSPHLLMCVCSLLLGNPNFKDPYLLA